jgi:hypothetical protein
MQIKVYRNVLLKGVISKEKALDLLSKSKLGYMENEVILKWRGKDIIVSRDDMGDVCIDLYDTELEEAEGGEFEEC